LLRKDSAKHKLTQVTRRTDMLLRPGDWLLWKAVPLGMLLGIVAVFGLPTASFAAGSSTESIPVSFGYPNPCSGTIVNLNGNYHAVIYIGTSGPVFHLVVDISYSGLSGTGDDGTAYSATGFSNMTNNAVEPGVVYTQPSSFMLISYGGSPNFAIHALQHITVNANGVVTVSIDNYSATCSS
jgi:hypothetical protein